MILVVVPVVVVLVVVSGKIGSGPENS